VRELADVLAVTESVTVPEPVPEPPPVTVIHPALLVEVHEQPAAAVTATDAVPALSESRSALVESVYPHDAPAWVTVTTWPATVSVPVRGLVDGLAVTEKPTAPEPLVVLPLVTVIHAVLLAAVHVHPDEAVTATDPPPAVDATAIAPVASVKVQDVPACVTLTVCPAIEIASVRGLVSVLAAAVTVTVRLPVPVVGVTDNHEEPAADHVHVEAELATVKIALPPEAGKFQLVGVTVIVHAGGVVVVLGVRESSTRSRIPPALVW
jgi:hypothetical protein